MRSASLSRIGRILVSRIKERGSVALAAMQTEKYGFSEAKSKTPRAYAQSMFRHARAAEMTTTYHQLLACWNGLELAFQMQVPERTPETTMTQSLEVLDSKASIFARMAPRKQSDKQSGQYNNRSSNRNSFSSFQKQPTRLQGFQSYQSQVNPQGYQCYNRDYYGGPRPNYQSSISNPQQTTITTSSRQPLLLTQGKADGPSNTYGSSNQKGKQPVYQSKDTSAQQNQGFRPRKAYVVEEPDEAFVSGDSMEEEEPLGHTIDENRGGYHADFDTEYYGENGSDDYGPMANFSTVHPPREKVSLPAVKCRKCKHDFDSNDLLHRHLREDCKKTMDTPAPSAYVTTRSAAAPKTIEAAKSSANPAEIDGIVSRKDSPQIMKSSANSALDIGTGYGFRNWHYVTAKFKLSTTAKSEPVCLDTGCSLTLVDRAFLTTQAPDVPVRTMASPITVRGIGSDNHARLNT